MRMTSGGMERAALCTPGPRPKLCDRWAHVGAGAGAVGTSHHPERLSPPQLVSHLLSRAINLKQGPHMEAAWGSVSAWEAVSQDAGYAAGRLRSPGAQLKGRNGAGWEGCTQAPGGGLAPVLIPVLPSLVFSEPQFPQMKKDRWMHT